ncbi:hypothetical protein ACFLS7_04035 [Bacteroidota bacterium]
MEPLADGASLMESSTDGASLMEPSADRGLRPDGNLRFVVLKLES